MSAGNSVSLHQVGLNKSPSKEKWQRPIRAGKARAVILAGTQWAASWVGGYLEPLIGRLQHSSCSAAAPGQ